MVKKLKCGLITALTLMSSFAFAEEKILFVCTGNTGRSVMAEYYANDYAQTQHLNIVADSAGVKINPNKATPEQFAITVMAQQGINIKDHIAKKIHKININDSKLVLVMTKKQKQALLKITPKAHHIYTLNECAMGSKDDIADAYGKQMSIYIETRNQIEADIKKIYDNHGQCINLSKPHSNAM